MARVRASGRWTVPGASGSIASGWKVNTYIAGTSTPKDTYTTNDESVANANPVILDSRGEATIYWAGTYKIVVTDENDVEVWSEDNYGEGETFVLTGNYNIIKNGSFETDVENNGEPDDWTVVDYSGGSHSLDSTDQFSGLRSLKFTSTGTGGGYATSDYFEAQEAKDLTFQWIIKSSVADVRNVVDVLWYTSAKTLISTTNIYDDSTTNPTTFTEFTQVATPPSTTRYAQVRVYGCHSSDATNGSTWFDGLIAISLIGTMAAQDSDSIAVTGGTAIGLTRLATTNFSQLPPTTTGTGAAYVATTGETVLTEDRTYNVQIHTDNTGACTLHLDGLLAKNVKLLDGSDPKSGLLKTGMVAKFMYDLTNMILLNPYYPDLHDNNHNLFYLGSGDDGSKTVSASEDLASGEYHYTDLTINAGQTLGVSESDNGWLVIRVSDIFTMTSTSIVDLDGKGATGGASQSTPSTDGNTGSAGLGGGSGGGGGSSDSTDKGGAGGDSTIRGISISGGALSADGPDGDGNAGTATSTRLKTIIQSQVAGELYKIIGSGGGSGGYRTGAVSGAGGNGGGGIIIIADIIDFPSGAIITSDGAVGSNSTEATSGAGGGGGGGVVILAARSYTSSAGTITVTGGAGGTDTGNSGAGGAGGAGYSVVITL
jgi:hypothetical protein